MNTSPPRDMSSNGRISSHMLGKVEPSFLVCKNGNSCKLNEGGKTQNEDGHDRHPSKPADIKDRRKSSRGLRKLRGLSKNGSRRRIGIDNTDDSNKAMNTTTKCPSVPVRLVSLESSFDSMQNNAMNNQMSRRKRSGHLLPSIVGSMTTALYRYTLSARDIMKAEKVCLIQAVFRGFLGRAKAKEQRLLNRLQGIEKGKKMALQQIEEYKHEEISNYHAKLAVEARNQKERWQNKSDVIAQLIPKVRSVRETNAKLMRELVHLRRENKQLAIANSAILRSAAKEEWRINKIERCGLQLHGVATDYREALLDGRKRLRDLDASCMSVNVEEDLGDEYSGDRLSEIKMVLYRAKVEDQLL